MPLPWCRAAKSSPPQSSWTSENANLELPSDANDRHDQQIRRPTSPRPSAHIYYVKECDRRERGLAVKVITSVDDAIASVGQPLGVSNWTVIDQKRIDMFADVTEDRQWIHVDVERAANEGPYGATIAHGFLTLSLIPMLSRQVYRVENARLGMNYGLNKVRFLAPVVVGSRVRVRSELLDVTEVADQTVNIVIQSTVEVDGSKKPAAVADMIARIFF